MVTANKYAKISILTLLKVGFANFKRGIIGAFHHVSEEHMDRYLNNFAFRWDNRKTSEGEQTVEAIKWIEGKRLQCKDPINK